MTRESDDLDNAGYSVDQKILAKKAVSPGELADILLEEERWRQVLSSLVVCFFARGIYSPDIVSKLLRLSGFEVETKDLGEIGDAVYREKYRFKKREGFSLDKLRIPKRIHETSSPVQPFDEAFVRQALDHVRRAFERQDAGSVRPRCQG